MDPTFSAHKEWEAALEKDSDLTEYFIAAYPGFTDPASPFFLFHNEYMDWRHRKRWQHRGCKCKRCTPDPDELTAEKVFMMFLLAFLGYDCIGVVNSIVARSTAHGLAQVVSLLCVPLRAAWPGFDDCVAVAVHFYFDWVVPAVALGGLMALLVGAAAWVRSGALLYVMLAFCVFQFVLANFEEIYDTAVVVYALKAAGF